MGLSGDFSGLAKAQAKIVATKVVPFSVAQAVAPVLEEASRSTFNTKANLYGDPWADISPKTYARGTKSILVRSGALMAAINATPQANKIRFMLGLEYGKYAVAKRRSPYPKGRLPPSWRPIIERETQAAFRKALNG